MKKIDSIVLSGKETLPLIEGGKGIAISSGESSGAWAKAGGVGTFSGVNADSYDENGNLIPQIYKEKNEIVILDIGGGYGDNFYKFSRFNESKLKGSRRYVTFGTGFIINQMDLNVSYLFSTSNVRSPLENTLRFSLAFNIPESI